MKAIQKGMEPAIFTAWKALANDDWQPSYDILGNPEKKAVKQALMLEQGYICCYCECRLLEDDSHIEHFVPQSESDIGALDFANMLCSCQQNLAKGTPLHCGNLKADQKVPISPLDPDCATRFIFAADGRVLPASVGDQAAVDAWYLFWLLPCAVLRPSRTAWPATFLLPLAYFNGDYLPQIGLVEFAVPLPVTLAEIGILACTCYLDWRAPLAGRSAA